MIKYSKLKIWYILSELDKLPDPPVADATGSAGAADTTAAAAAGADTTAGGGVAVDPAATGTQVGYLLQTRTKTQK